MKKGTIVRPADSKFADAIFQIKGNLPHTILHRGIISFLSQQQTGQNNRIHGKVVLEAGCGPGGFTKKLCRLEPQRIVAGDINEQMLVRAETKVNDARVTFQRLDLTQPFELNSNAFDWVICISVLMHLPPPISTQAISEFGRVTRPGGTVLVAVLSTDWAEAVYQPAGDGEAYTRLVPAGGTSIREFYPPSEQYLEAFESAGMKVDRWEICVPPEGREAGPPYDTRVGEPVWTVYIGRCEAGV